MEGFLFVLQGALIVTSAYFLVRAMLPRRERWRQTLSILVLMHAIAYATIVLLAIPKALSAGTVLITLGLFAALAIWRNKRHAARDRAATTPKPFRFHMETHGPMAIALATVIAHSVSRLIQGTPFGSDDLNYGGPLAAHLVASAGLSWLPNTYQAHYPLNIEVFSAWLMIPSGDDRFVYLASCFWFLMACFAVYSIVRAASPGANDRGIAFSITALFAASPVVWFQAGSFAPVDLATAALLLSALALSLPCAEKADSSRNSVEDAAVVGIATGLAIGAKVTAAPIALVLWAYMLFFRPSTSRGGIGIRRLVALFAPVVFFGSLWYIRNLLATGNPLFPAELAFFDGPFEREFQARTSLAWWLATGFSDVSQWHFIARGYLEWPSPLVAACLLGVLLAPIVAATKRSELPAPCLDSVGLLLICALLFLFLWPATPFSATVNAPEADLVILKGRLVFVFAASLCLFGIAGSLLDRTGLGRRVWWTIVVVVWFVIQPPRASLVLGFGLIIIVTWWGLHSAQITVSQRRRALLVLVPALCVLLLVGVLHNTSKRLADRNLWDAGKNYGLTPAWQAIDALEGARVTSYGVRSLWYYPLFGRALQNSPVYVDRLGKARPPMHEEWRDGRFYWWQAHEESLKTDLGISADELIENLRASGIEFVMFGFREGSVPPQYLLLRDRVDTRSIYAGPNSSLLQIKNDRMPEMENPG